MSGNTRRRSSRRRSSRRRSSRRRGGKMDTTCIKHIDKVLREASATTVEQKITAINNHLSKCTHPADMQTWLRVKFLKKHTELLEQQQKEKEQRKQLKIKRKNKVVNISNGKRKIKKI